MSRIGRPPKPFWEYVDKTGDCWLWTGTRNPEGYGMFARIVQGRQRYYMAHRWAFILEVGPIPIDFTIDHLCRVTSCVNPAHLEAVPHQVNILRGNGPAAINARKTHCPLGHLLEPKRNETRRWCPTCNRRQDALRQRNRRLAEKRRRHAAGAA